MALGQAQSPLPAEHTRINIVNKSIRFATYNICTGGDGEKGERRMADLAGQLADLNIHVAGVQELRRPGSGREQMPGSDWHMVWSGQKKNKVHGVGLLMTPAWEAAMHTWSPVSDRLLEAQFRANRHQSVTCIVAYAPTEKDAGSPSAENFYSDLSDMCARANRRGDVVIVLGDFNAALGRNTWLTHRCVGRQIPPHEPKEPSPNGETLLALATGNNMTITNTIFRHAVRHQYTHRSNRILNHTRKRHVHVARELSVKDYILVSTQHMHSVRDCRVFQSVFLESADHLLLAATLRLSLRSEKPRPQPREWDSSLLQVEERGEQFCADVQASFDELSEEEKMDGQLVSSSLAAALTTAAKAHLRPVPGSRHRTKFSLSPGTMHLQAARRKAHAAWLSNRTTAARTARNRINRQTDRAVQLDMQAFTDRQAKDAEEALAKGNVRGWSKISKKMAGAEQARAAGPHSMKDAEGKVQHGNAAVLEVMTSHFESLLGGESTISEAQLNQLAAAATQHQLQHGPEEHEAHGRPPDPEETAKAVSALRRAAAAGSDKIDASLLRAGKPILDWIHLAVTAVWNSGKSPKEWRFSVITAIYKRKGPKDSPGNYRGISLLSIVGKVYASILLHRVSEQIEPQLHEAQCGFRKGRGTSDAMYTLRSLESTCKRHGACMAKAYIDFTKAYDCINREALWSILKTYGVNSHVISLLEDLHSETFAAVKLDGQVGREFQVTTGVRQGCVIAPTLFNVIIDFIIRKALRLMPANCGISIRTRKGGLVSESSIEHIVLLMYADDLVLVSHDPAELALMLKIIDEESARLGLFINASKTEIQIHDPQINTLPSFNVSTGPVSTCEHFKYLGAWFAEDGKLMKEIKVRKARVLGKFHEFDKLWANKKLKLRSKMRVYNTFVLPHFLYGCESWIVTLDMLAILNSAHNHCLRQILGFQLLDRQPLKYIYKICDSQPIESLITKHIFRWVGHVMRMDGSRLPRMAFDCDLEVPLTRGPGRPPMDFRQTYAHLLMRYDGRVQARPQRSEVWKQNVDDLFVCAQDRQAWKSRVHGFSLKSPVDTSAVRRSERQRAAVNYSGM